MRKFKDLPILAKFISESYLQVCTKRSESSAITEYGNTLFDAEDDVLYHGTEDGLPDRVVSEYK
jgi:hypothetical protein